MTRWGPADVVFNTFSRGPYRADEFRMDQELVKQADRFIRQDQSLAQNR